jgi:hypothetical protein
MLRISYPVHTTFRALSDGEIRAKMSARLLLLAVRGPHMNEQRSEVLSGWKDIANYLEQGVRTVQRYEYELGLPVHRPAGRLRGSVIAAKSDLDAWVAARPAREIPVLLDSNPDPSALISELKTRLAEFKRLREETAQSRQALAKSRKVLRESLATTVSATAVVPPPLIQSEDFETKSGRHA